MNERLKRCFSIHLLLNNILCLSMCCFSGNLVRTLIKYDNLVIHLCQMIDSQISEIRNKILIEKFVRNSYCSAPFGSKHPSNFFNRPTATETTHTLHGKMQNTWNSNCTVRLFCLECALGVRLTCNFYPT